MALAECESALRQYVNREYFLAEGSRQRINFQARWMAQSGRVGAVYPNWDAYQVSIDTMVTPTRCCADNPLHVVYRHRVQTSSSCHTHGLTL